MITHFLTGEDRATSDLLGTEEQQRRRPKTIDTLHIMILMLLQSLSGEERRRRRRRRVWNSLEPAEEENSCLMGCGDI